jgi:hypothetical protein
MEEAHLRVSQLAVGCQLQGFPDIAQEHVGALHFAHRPAEGLGDCFLDQAFLQADAQVASHDLDDVLGFQGRDLREKFSHQGSFCGWPAGCCELAEPGGNLQDSQASAAGLCPAWTGGDARPHMV